MLDMHIAAGVYHHTIRRDDVLRRMLPGGADETKQRDGAWPVGRSRSRDPAVHFRACTPHHDRPPAAGWPQSR